MPAVTAHHLPVLQNALERNRKLLERFADGIDARTARTPLYADGSHLQWLLGHLVSSRDALLRAAGGDPVWTKERAAPYTRGSTADVTPDDAPVDLLALLATQQERVATLFARLGDDDLARPQSGTTLGEWLEFLTWHEGYHVGQAVLYRRGAGLASTIG